MWFKRKKESDNDVSRSRKSTNTSEAYPPEIKADWKDVEVYDDKVSPHKILARDVFVLCYDISQSLGTSQPDKYGNISYRDVPYSQDYRAKYEDDVICVTCSGGRDQHGQPTAHWLHVTYKPKEAEVLSVSFSVDDATHKTRPTRPDWTWQISQFRVGSWIDHLASLEPRVARIHADYTNWQQSNDAERDAKLERQRQQQRLPQFKRLD